VASGILFGQKPLAYARAISAMVIIVTPVPILRRHTLHRHTICQLFLRNYLKMVKEFVLHLAYKACEKKSKLFGKHPNQYQSAVNLISILMLIHLTQLVILLFRINYPGNTTFVALAYLILIASFFAMQFLVKLVLSKAVLAKSIKYYKEKQVFKYSKLILFSYGLINLLILSFIVITRP
jgi:hypothetical protein